MTDGPFLHRLTDGTLLMLWSTFIGGQYAQCLVRFADGEIGMDFVHLLPLVTSDGGHGMIFRGGEKLYLTYHSPNQTDHERPHFVEIEESEHTISLKG